MTEAAESTSRGIRRHPHLEIPVGGETVAATRYEPLGLEEPAPALLMYVPYPKDDVITYGAYDPINRYLANEGYEVVVADMVGTGASTGRFEDMFRRTEGEDAADIVRWLADRDWTSGRVGMYGKSYGGYTALAAAAERPEPLDAILPVFTPYTGYRNGYTDGGLFELLYIGMDWLTLMQSLDVKPPSRRDGNGDWRAVWEEHLDAVDDREPWLFQFLDNDVKDGYWADKEIPVGDIRTPTFAVGGWRDPYTRDTVEYYRAIDAPKRLLLGPWRHRMPHRGRESAIEFRREACDWFDQFLRDDAGGADREPAVQVWTERDGGGKVDGGVWRGLERWPRVGEGTPTVTFALAPWGVVPSDRFQSGRVEREYEPDYSVGLQSVGPATMATPVPESSDDDARSVTADSDPLERPLELTGTGAASVPLRTSMADPTVSVRLVDVAPDGSSTTVTHGARRLRCLEDCSSLGTVPRGEFVTCRVPLQPKSHVFEAGHRLRLALAGSLFPWTMPTGAPGTMAFRSTPAAPLSVEFPGRFRSDDRFGDALEKPAPDGTIPPSSPRIAGADGSWEAERDPTTGRASVRKTASLTVDLPHAVLSREGVYRVTVDPGDPASVSAANELEWTLDYPDDTVRVVASNRFDRESAEVTSTVTFDDEVVFEQAWRR